MIVWKADQLWEYSLALYSNNSVQECSLRLQDEFGFNVNLLLLCCYLNQARYQLETTDIDALLDSIKGSESRLNLQRNLRRQAKGTAKYKALLDTELALERIQQAQLINALNNQHTNQGSNNNLMTYASQHKTKTEAMLHTQLLLQLSQLAKDFSQIKLNRQ